MATDDSSTAAPASPSTDASSAPAASGGDAASGSGGGAAAGGGQMLAGGLIIPDLSSITTMQNENTQKMTAAVQAASQGLQSLVSDQKATLQKALGTLQSSLNSSVTTADAGSGKVPDIQSQITNLSVTIDNLNKAAETLTASTGKSFDAISQSMTQSLAIIERTAEKFSSGG
ncbi:MAG: hypothetical protein EP348_08360 [Alphaproteobacteria bacterium]|nr:MAG: hypothetical protein EP348_08360 [Alphaproteobacteria bacterium]